MSDQHVLPKSNKSTSPINSFKKRQFRHAKTNLEFLQLKITMQSHSISNKLSIDIYNLPWFHSHQRELQCKSEFVVKNTHILLTVTLRELQLYSLVGTRAQIPMHCSNRDRKMFFLSVIEPNSQGSFNHAQNKTR